MICDFVVSSSISHLQLSFVKNRSTSQQLLLYILNFLLELLTITKLTRDHLSWFMEAFDISHNKTLIKVWDNGFTGSLWHFFKAYLTGRRQSITLQVGFLPLPEYCEGSVLGRLLFILYINDLPSVLSSSQPFVFVDDTKCCKWALSLPDSFLLQTELDSLCHWSSQNGLSFNVFKCCLLHFCNRINSPISVMYYLDGVLIPFSDNCKDLGVTFSIYSDLSWSQQYIEPIDSLAWYDVHFLFHFNENKGIPSLIN